MTRFLRILTVVHIALFATTAFLSAEIGTQGGSNEIPWIIADSTQAGTDVTFTVHGIDPANPYNYYFLGFSTKKLLKGGIKFPICGPGAQFIPDLSAVGAGICPCYGNPIVIPIPWECA
ncbi:MAG: hypothetical protein ACYTG7_16935, partial [Planctomycetota bacterium]